MKIFETRIFPNGRRHFSVCGIKVASWHGCPPRVALDSYGANNTVDIPGKNIAARVYIYGNNNTIQIGESIRGGKLNIHIRGNNNKIHIMPSDELVKLDISIGNHMEISNSEIFIDEHACIVGIEILVEQHHCKMHVGKNCLMSKDILFRLGEIPHLVFDAKTHEYVDTPAELTIGDHVWIGAGATLLKKVKIGNDCIVGTRAVVTKEFNENNVLLAGNPAQIKRRDVYWVGAYRVFRPNELEYKKSYEKYIGKFGEPSNLS